MALQPPDLDGLAFGDFTNANLLAQGFGRTHAPAHAAHDIGGENCLRRANRIARRDLSNEQRDIDRRGTGLDAGRVIAEQAPLGRHPRIIRLEPRLDIREISVICVWLEPSSSNVRQFRHHPVNELT